MSIKPNKWIAALLGFVAPPLAMMYVARAKLALVYLVLIITAGIAGILSSHWGAASGYASLAVALGGAWHAYVLASRFPDDGPRPAYSRWYGVIGAFACFAVLVLGVRAFVVEPFRAPSGSMLPTIPFRAVLLVKKWGYGNYGTFGLSVMRGAASAPLSRGDLIVFEFPSNRSVVYVKRLVGLPGDKVTYREKQLFINGLAVPLRPDGEFHDLESIRHIPRFVESMSGKEHSVLMEKRPDFAMAKPRFPLSERCTYLAGEISCDVPAGHFFVMGDNRDNSQDSRFWGFVPADHIVGKVVFVGS